MSSATYLTQSLEDEAVSLETLVANELGNAALNNIFSTDTGRQACIETISSQKKICSKVRQVMSDELSGRKRRACNMLFNALGYQCLQPRYITHSEDQNAAKQMSLPIPSPRCFEYAMTEIRTLVIEGRGCNKIG